MYPNVTDCENKFAHGTIKAVVSIRFCMVMGAKWVSKFGTLLGGSKVVDGSTMVDLILLILLTKNDKYNTQSEVAEIVAGVWPINIFRFKIRPS